MRWRGPPLASWRALAAGLSSLLATSPALAVLVQRQETHAGLKWRKESSLRRFDSDPSMGTAYTDRQGWAAISDDDERPQDTRARRRDIKTAPRTAEDIKDFPERLDGMKLVGQLCRTYLGWHLYTVGIYLDQASPSWGRTYTQRNISELLRNSVGHLRARYKVTRRVTRRLFYNYAVESMTPFVHGGGAEALVQEYRQAVMAGPTFYPGLMLETVSTSSGLRYVVNNLTEARGDHAVEHIGNVELSMALLGSFVEDGAEVKEFRTMLLENLANGPDADSNMIWAGSYKDKLPAKVIVIIIVGAIVVLSLLVFSCMFVWRRFKRPSGQAPPSAGGMKRPGGAQPRAGVNQGASRFAAGAPATRSPANLQSRRK